ncbi:uncharacterized protein [Eurosta solidaginis]|uniref:uncharacterized protein n=1 Tax=Eurosta solidaginis TaxID=178769 RepID=UPI0035312DC9
MWNDLDEWGMNHLEPVIKEVSPLPQALETCTQTDIGSRNSQRANSSSDEDILDITEFTSGSDKNRSGNLNDSDTDPGLRKFKVNKTDTPFMLYDYLTNDIDGKAIIKAYEGKNFNAKVRNLVVRRLINREKEKAFKAAQLDKSPKFCLSPEILKQYSAEIATVFPNENPSVYYIPYENKNGMKIGPSGKLVSHYNYIVGDLKRKGLIKSELSHKDKSSSCTCH